MLRELLLRLQEMRGQLGVSKLLIEVVHYFGVYLGQNILSHSQMMSSPPISALAMTPPCSATFATGAPWTLDLELTSTSRRPSRARRCRLPPSSPTRKASPAAQQHVRRCGISTTSTTTPAFRSISSAWCPATTAKSSPNCAKPRTGPPVWKSSSRTPFT